MNKAMRDMMFMFIRFPGWNIGSVRSLTATGRGIAKLATGKPVDYQAQAAMEYALGLGINVSIMSTLTQLTLTKYNTGTFEFPSSPMDFVAPRTGRINADGTAERLWFPSYIRDYMGFVHEPIREIIKGNPAGAAGKVWATASAKMAPGLRMAYELFTNKNYFGEQVFTPGAGALRQAGELASHVGKEYLVPFGPQQAMHAGGTAEAIANIAGITSVPRRYLRSPALETISEFNALKRGIMTKSEAEKADYRRDFLDAVRKGDMEEARKIGKEAVEALRFSPSDLGALVRESKEHPLVGGFKHLSLEEALKVYKVADDKERKMLVRPLVTKLQIAPMIEKVRLREEIKAIMEDAKSRQEAPRRVKWY
jgi:hypothetical protein